MTSIFLDMLVRDLKSEILESIPTMLSKSLSMAAEKKYRQHISDVLDDMICYQGPAYDQMSEGFDAIRMSLLQLNNFDDYLDFTRQISLFIKRA